MSYKLSPPGSWVSFLKLKENQNVPILEVKRRYIKQQLLFENAYIAYQQAIFHNKVQGGKKEDEENPEVEILTENSEFILSEDGKFLIEG